MIFAASACWRRRLEGRHASRRRLEGRSKPRTNGQDSARRARRADARAREHRDRGLGTHWHVEQHAVARRDAELAQRPRERLDVGEEFLVRDLAAPAADRRDVAQGYAIAEAGGNVAVQRVIPAARCLSPRNIHVPAAAAPRLVPTECPRPSRGGAATRLHGMSTSRPRRRRDSSTECPRRSRGGAATYLHEMPTSRPRPRRDSPPPNVHVAAAAPPRLASTE